jgi:drug/metabolite transporter (DMT)-like permease
MKDPGATEPAGGMDRVVVAALLLQSALAAGTHLVAKQALKELPPITLLMCRFAASGAVYLTLLFVMRAIPPRRAWPRILVLGFLAGPLNQGLFFFGLSRSVPAHASLLYALTPAGVLAYAVLRGRERLSARALAGIGAAFAGVTLLLLGRGLSAAASPAVGDAFILLAVGAWVLYTAEGKGLVGEFGWFRATAWTMAAGAVMSLPLAPWLVDWALVKSVSGPTLACIGYLAILSSVLAYFLWYFALGRAPASRVAVFNNFQPVFTALAAWALLGDALTWEIWAGGALVLLGVRAAQRARANVIPRTAALMQTVE